MRIGVVSSKVGGQIDQLLSTVAARLQAEGLQLYGAIKVLEDSRENTHYCDMDLQVLPDGPVIRITQSLGDGASGCRLNPAAITEAVAATEQHEAGHFDLFVLNKFGPQEAEGRGFCDAIASALDHGNPVLVGVGGACRDAFDAFVDGLAESLPPDSETIYNWCKSALTEDQAH